MADQAAVAVENARLLARSAARRVGRAAPAGPRAARLGLPAAVLHDAAHPGGRQTPVGGAGGDDLLPTLDELAHAALNDMRALIFELHPTLLDTHGLVGAVREQAAWITRRGGPG